MKAHRLRTPRTARYFILGDPAEARDVWFVVHGYGQLAEPFLGRFEALPGAGATRAVVAPEGLSRFYVEREVGPHGPKARVGASWMTREEREYEVRDYIEYLDRVAGEVLGGGVDGPDRGEAAPLDGGDRRVVLVGFSQGAETASRWAVHGRLRPAELVLWGGGLAADLASGPAREALDRLEIRLVVGTDDEWAARRVAESRDRLKELGLEAERLEYAGGHRIEAEVLRRYWPG